MTEKLYYKDPYLFDFNAQITSKVKSGEGWIITLDRTAFYPEGGGQPADRGHIGGVPVNDVQKENGEIYHFLKELPSSGSVACSVDRNFRFDFMQQHTGQHLLSAALRRVLGIATVAVRQAEDYTSIEIDRSDFSRDEADRIEEAANRLVCANHPVHTYFNGNIPIESFPLRRETKFRDNVRLVQIGGESLEDSPESLNGAAEVLSLPLTPEKPEIQDLSACGGVHTVRTGEVGLIRFQKAEKVRGRLRLFWLIGERAYRDYRVKSDLTDRIGEALSVPLSGIGDEFERLLRAAAAEKKRNGELLKELAGLKAGEIARRNGKGERIYILENADPDYFKQIMIALSSRDNICLCLLNRREENGQWALISSLEKTLDFQIFRNEHLSLIKGAGGGRAPLWQGKIGDLRGIDLFCESVSTFLT